MYLAGLSRLILLSCFGVYCFIYPSSLFLLMTNQVPPGTEWMASLMLTLEGVVAAGWVAFNYRRGRGLAAALAVLAGAFGVETLGVLTGVPFGRYQYTDVLAPKLLEVPVAITFAWMMIVVSSFFTAHFVVRQLWPGRGLGTIIGLGTALAVFSDLLMEPVAANIQNYWVWYESGPYYNVPTANFIAWGITSLLLILVLVRLSGEGIDSNGAGSGRLAGKFGYNFIPAALFVMNLVLFTGINLARSNYLAGILGTLGGMLVIGLIARARGVGPLSLLRPLLFLSGKHPFPSED